MKIINNRSVKIEKKNLNLSVQIVLKKLIKK